MSKRYEHAGTVNFWKEKKPTFWETVGNVVGGLIAIIFVLGLIASGGS